MAALPTCASASATGIWPGSATCSSSPERRNRSRRSATATARSSYPISPELLASGATITQAIVDVPTGRMLYARHADGLHVEYVEWTDDLVERFIRAPQREGRLSSEL